MELALASAPLEVAVPVLVLAVVVVVLVLVVVLVVVVALVLVVVLAVAREPDAGVLALVSQGEVALLSEVRAFVQARGLPNGGTLLGDG